ncbi:hypothetical protein BG74_02630 [Sodalis-like endosymbiont of Proechinophthirus fluctus]|uniref:thiamine pyrophosphate-binding protein n=1 Tax=Sodalis-like endosymbiont of Proechinophthirus fluctus TaxID=1462730 RepID=UPI0007A8E3F5|nr:hypothetical protein BG74_02630 [Sodalis-like endosymbiont of Proechinophthirus fluctus]
MGATRIYGYPRDGINGILARYSVLPRTTRVVQVCHKEMAAFMATAHAELTGELGVCLSTGDPGAMHLLTSLYV